MVYCLLALVIVIIDQMTKYYILEHFSLGESVPVIQNIFHWTFILNPGAAFGMLEGNRWLFVVIACAVIVGIWFMRKEIVANGVGTCVGTALFVGGAVGNLIDRAVNGVVIDFFDFRIWPVFNVADIAICTGVGLIIWSILKMELIVNKKN